MPYGRVFLIHFLPHSAVAVACSWAAEPTLKGPKDDGRGVAGCPRRGGDGRGGPVLFAGAPLEPGGDLLPFSLPVCLLWTLAPARRRAGYLVLPLHL